MDKRTVSLQAEYDTKYFNLALLLSEKKNKYLPRVISEKQTEANPSIRSRF